MKKIKNIFMLTLVFCFFCMNFTYINAKSHKLDKTWVSETEKFNDIQDKITESLTRDEKHYVYDKEYVSNLLAMIDFKELNVELGTTYTLESLKMSVLNDLDSSFAAALEKKNGRGGVVADVNKYTVIYTITAQVNWYE